MKPTNLQFFCPRWGSEGTGWETFFARLKAEGYNGMEWGVALDTPHAELDKIWDLAEQKRVAVILQHYDTVDADFNRHYDTYCRWLSMVKGYPAVKINSQTGRDIFTFDQNKALIEAATQFTVDTDIAVVHETHRHKFSFAAHIAKEFLQRIPHLRLTLDVSHWVCVAESYLEDQKETVALAIERADHLHARVGYPEGPQIPDPRVPEWDIALRHHLVWWDAVVARHRAQNKPLTVTPEFGPYPYMVELPFTRQPLTSQWEINAWMMRMLGERYR
ncbi:sugar phosphate isomerase/epimerase [Dinghuibacter silviterrae]|uniref:Sugar phosphate isomerase/epimerase n=1 Tax=Dinghuibacter silviterrae TaxID=1539049 RepID=A0A4R8DFA0_9BACT|nr:sugar phosphate isomerase/epimerase [Dinghuibacter silviterrae]TDW95914.1 hypothetical protein EDB95_3735 [Dinghuibacter silviterrae]